MSYTPIVTNLLAKTGVDNNGSNIYTDLGEIFHVTSEIPKSILSIDITSDSGKEYKYSFDGYICHCLYTDNYKKRVTGNITFNAPIRDDSSYSHEFTIICVGGGAGGSLEDDNKDISGGAGGDSRLVRVLKNGDFGTGGIHESLYFQIGRGGEGAKATNDFVNDPNTGVKAGKDGENTYISADGQKIVEVFGGKGGWDQKNNAEPAYDETLFSDNGTFNTYKLGGYGGRTKQQNESPHKGGDAEELDPTFIPVSEEYYSLAEGLQSVYSGGGGGMRRSTSDNKYSGTAGGHPDKNSVVYGKGGSDGNNSDDTNEAIDATTFGAGGGGGGNKDHDNTGGNGRQGVIVIMYKNSLGENEDVTNQVGLKTAPVGYRSAVDTDINSDLNELFVAKSSLEEYPAPDTGFRTSSVDAEGNPRKDAEGNPLQFKDAEGNSLIDENGTVDLSAIFQKRNDDVVS